MAVLVLMTIDSITCVSIYSLSVILPYNETCFPNSFYLIHNNIITGTKLFFFVQVRNADKYFSPVRLPYPCPTISVQQIKSLLIKVPVVHYSLGNFDPNMY